MRRYPKHHNSVVPILTFLPFRSSVQAQEMKMRALPTNLIQTDLTGRSNREQVLEMIMDMDETERTWEFDSVDDVLGDDVLMEGIDGAQHSHADDILLDMKDQPCKKDDDEGEEIGTDNNDPDDKFLSMMQEPIVEDPRHEYCDMISLHEEPAHNPLSARIRGHRHLQRHVSWTAPGRVSPDPNPSCHAITTSSDTFEECLEHFALSLRQSEATSALIRHQVYRAFHKANDFENASHDFPPTRASFSVDETRRSLLSLVEGQRHRSNASSSCKPQIRRCKSSDVS